MPGRVIPVPLRTNYGPSLPALNAPSLVAVGTSPTQITLTATYAGPPGATSYVFAVLTGSFFIDYPVQASNVLVVNGLGPGETFYYRVGVLTAESPSRATAWSAIVPGTTAVIANPIISTTSVPAGTQGVAYSQQFAATLGTAPYTWAETGALPAGVTFTSSGLLAGTPTTNASYALTINCTDVNGLQATPVTLNLVINAPAVTVPAQVQGLVATATGQTTTALTWTALATAVSYIVYRAGVQVGTSTSASYADTGLTASTAYSYTVAGVNTAGTGPQSASASVMTQASSPVGTVWAPGHKMLSVVNYGNVSECQSEINILAQGETANPGVFNEYMSQWAWQYLQPTSKGVYLSSGYTTPFAPIFQVANYLWSKLPNYYFGAEIAAYVNWISAFSASGGQGCLPAYIYSGGTATYGLPPIGASGAGWTFSTYNGNAGTTNGTYQYTNPNLSNVNVMNEFTAMYVALLNTPFLTTSGPYAGMTFTPNTHPRWAAIGDWGPDDVNMVTADGKGTNPTLSSGYSGVQWEANFRSRNATIVAAATQTSWLAMPGYGATSDLGVSEQLSNIQNFVTTRTAVSCTDVFYTGTGNGLNLTYAQNFFVGNQNTGSNTPPPTFTAGGTDYRGKTPSMPNVQGYDYAHRTTGALANTAAQVTGIALNAINTLRASAIYWQMPVPTSGWLGFVVPGVIAAGPIPALNQLLPANYLYPVTGLSTSAITQNTITLNWTPNAGAATYTAYLNGTAVQTGITGTSYQYTGLAVSTPYSLTVAMANANGTGPPSTALPVTTTAQALSQVGGVNEISSTTTTITLGWTAVTGATSYTITRGGTVIAATAPGVQYTDTGLTTGTSYSYTVAANAAGNTGPASVVVSMTTTGSGATIPTGLQMLLQGQTSAFQGNAGVPQAPNSLSLSWNAVAGAATYNVYRATSAGGTYSDIGSSATPAYTDATATLCVNGTAGAGPIYNPANTYCYKVTAVVGGVESAQSAMHVYNWSVNPTGAPTAGLAGNGLGVDYTGTGATVTYGVTDPFGGTDTCIKIQQPTSGYWLPVSSNLLTQWNFWTGAFSSGYFYIDLGLSAPLGSAYFEIVFLRAGDVEILNSSMAFNWVLLAQYAQGAVSANGWTTYKVPVTAILTDYESGSPVMQAAMYKFNLNVQGGAPTYYVRNIIWKAT